MTTLQTEVAEVAERTGFSGAVRVDREGDTVVDADEHPRPGTSLESLARLRPILVSSNSM